MKKHNVRAKSIENSSAQFRASNGIPVGIKASDSGQLEGIEEFCINYVSISTTEVNDAVFVFLKR